MPYGAGPYGQSAGNPYVTPKKSRKGLYIALAVLAVVMLLGVGVVVIGVIALKDTTIATDVKLGDCITEVPTDTRVITLPTIDCAEPHSGEVYAVIDMPEGNYPGQAKIDQYQNKCPEELNTFAPDAMTDDSVGIYVLYPTPETWEGGDRAVTCIATLDPKRSGSLKE